MFNCNFDQDVKKSQVAIEQNGKLINNKNSNKIFFLMILYKNII